MQGIFCLGLEHFIQQLSTHAAEVFFPQVILGAVKKEKGKQHSCFIYGQGIAQGNSQVHKTSSVKSSILITFWQEQSHIVF